MGNLKGAAGSLFSSPDSARNKRNANEEHKCLVLPRVLHSATVEISFRERIKFKDIMTIVIGKEVNRMEGLSAPAEATPSFTFPSSEKFLHTSVDLPKELIPCLKKVAHYSGISEKQIIANGLASYLLQVYCVKYPDLLRPIESFKSIESK